MIEIQNLGYRYGNGPLVLTGISLRISDGEFVAIMGENGSGKTTLIKHLNGLLKPVEGLVLVDGMDTRSTSVASLSKLVGIVFQNQDHQLFSETVEQELSFGLKNFGYSGAQIKQIVADLAVEFGIKERLDDSPFSLSNGQKKRLAIAAVLGWKPKHLILDEPTIGQDQIENDRLRRIILDLTRQKRSVVIVTHDIEFVADCKPRLIILSRGKILADAPAEEILPNGPLLEKASLTQPQIGKLANVLWSQGRPKSVIDLDSAVPALLEWWNRTR